VIPAAWRYGLDDRENRFNSLPGQSTSPSCKRPNLLWVPSRLLLHGRPWVLLWGKAVVGRSCVWWRSAAPPVTPCVLWCSILLGRGRILLSFYLKEAQSNWRTYRIEWLVKTYKKSERLWKVVVDPWYKTLQENLLEVNQEYLESFHWESRRAN